MDLTLWQDLLPLPHEGTSSTTPSSATRGDGNRVCVSFLPTVIHGENNVPREAEPRLGLREDGIPLCPALAVLPQQI